MRSAEWLRVLVVGIAGVGCAPDSAATPPPNHSSGQSIAGTAAGGSAAVSGTVTSAGSRAPTQTSATAGHLAAGMGSPAAGSTAGHLAPNAGSSAPSPTAGTSSSVVQTTAGAGGQPVTTNPGEPIIPEPKAECKPFKTGDMTIAGSRVKIWAGEKKSKTGPLIFYWYATGGSVAEVNQGIPAASITEITGAGGIIAAMYQTTGKGMNTGNGVWYTDDYLVSDEIVACAAKIHDIDTHHIHALGWSAGGLQSGYMAYVRSNYMASVAPYSGGSLNRMLQNAKNVPAAMLFHGAPGVDVVVLDFSQSSDQMGADIKAKGGYALNCNHGGAHMIPGAPGPAAAQLFFKAHGYGVKPSPWAAMVPSGVPSYCKPY